MVETSVQAEEEKAPPQFELEQADDYSQYLLFSRSEILAVLRTLIQKNAMITVHFDQGRSFLLTSMISLAAENTGFFLDIGSDDEMNRRALKAKKRRKAVKTNFTGLPPSNTYWTWILIVGAAGGGGFAEM